MIDNTPATLHDKLASIRDNMNYLQKTEKGQNGTYVSGAVLLDKIRKEMQANRLSLTPQIPNYNVREVVLPASEHIKKHAITYVAEFPVIFEWRDLDSGEILSISWFAAGKSNSDPAMAVGSALTYCERYFLTKFFQIPTDELDPDSFADKATARLNKDQIKALEKLCTDYAFPVDATLTRMAQKVYNMASIKDLPETVFEDAKRQLTAKGERESA